MKQRIFTVVMIAVMMTASVGLAGCGGDDASGSGGGGIGNPIPSAYVGTWTCNEYCPEDNTYEIWAMYEEDGWPPTTVTINGDGSWSGNGLISGNGSCSIRQGSIADDGYYALITFYQGGKSVTAKVRTYMNDHRTGYVELQGYSDKWFVFKK